MLHNTKVTTKGGTKKRINVFLFLKPNHKLDFKVAFFCPNTRKKLKTVYVSAKLVIYIYICILEEQIIKKAAKYQVKYQE